MKVLIVADKSRDDQNRIADNLIAAMIENGDTPRVSHDRNPDIATIKAGFDAVVVWGWRIGSNFHAKGLDTLVIERGYIGDRFEWYSAGWNGLNGRARFPLVPDGGQRWQTYFAPLLRPWRHTSLGRYALVMGQVPTDTSLRNVNFRAWVGDACAAMQVRGLPVAYRPHPLAPRFLPYTQDVQVLKGDLRAALDGAMVTVTYNSNSAVDGILAGVPCIAMDQGSMAWDVATHCYSDLATQPDRTEWAHCLAWRQWRIAEFKMPSTWKLLKSVITTS